ncbi:hypothetical protein BGZ59_005735 [Podila verticillata]|nr:hypothetical protein BGZ59_005735 [Podila verticillata]KFH69178.1 hypothetical protein MVEG_05979 [Podila verticillata NRRL 6337]
MPLSSPIEPAPAKEEDTVQDHDNSASATVASPWMQLNGQIVHLRKCYKRLFFMDLRIDSHTKHTILFRSDDYRDDIPTLTDLELTKLWKRSKRGDVIELSCFRTTEEERTKREHQVYQAVDFQVLKAWPGFDPFPSEPAMGIKDTPAHSFNAPKQTEPSTIGYLSNTDDSDSWRDYCKFWINSHKCLKEDCRLKHPTGDEYTRVQEMWVNERTHVRKERARIQDDPHATSSKVPHSQRAFIFCRWIVEKYGREYLNSGSGVLDIAGGKGEISLFLTHMFGIRSTVVEPNVRRDKPYQRKNLMAVIRKQMDIEAGGDGHFYRQYTSSETELAESLPQDSKTNTSVDLDLDLNLDEEAKKKERRRIRKQQLSQFVVPRLSTLMNDQFEKHYPGVLESASILIGMHPDQATEPTVDMALKHGKPFAVVPCCVFAHENPERRLGGGGEVNTTFDFIQYLMEKGSSVSMQKGFLPFDGMNIVVYRPLEQPQ